MWLTSIQMFHGIFSLAIFVQFIFCSDFLPSNERICVIHSVCEHFSLVIYIYAISSLIVFAYWAIHFTMRLIYFFCDFRSLRSSVYPSSLPFCHFFMCFISKISKIERKLKYADGWSHSKKKRKLRVSALQAHDLRHTNFTSRTNENSR